MPAILQNLYYIVHLENIVSILRHGIYSHNQMMTLNLEHHGIDNRQVNERRANRRVGDRTLWDYANLYFQPRNAMLYQVVHQYGPKQVAILSLKKSLLKRKDIFVTTGNAASLGSEILASPIAYNQLNVIARNIDRDWWDTTDGSKRSMMAECLVPDQIAPEYIQTIYVASKDVQKTLRSRLQDQSDIRYRDLEIIFDPKRFFQPEDKRFVSRNLSLVRGDMFFSKMQTLTISVNCVGVMGKGLASTAKYRFPDVYVHYQEVCRKKQLSFDRPYLLKRESSVVSQLADDLPGEDLSPTWFLLFATKDHWRNSSKLENIEKGLDWLVKHYQTEGIQSLALPALGCGLGGLSWEVVGPLMCRYLAQLNIPVAIYLPAANGTRPEWLTAEFLLN
jgi:O-acetyl-ADP-ribose deacetylase (regulator of RNase III)